MISYVLTVTYHRKGYVEESRDASIGAQVFHVTMQEATIALAWLAIAHVQWSGIENAKNIYVIEKIVVTSVTTTVELEITEV